MPWPPAHDSDVRQVQGGWVRFKSQQERPERVVLKAALPKAKTLAPSAERTFWSVTSLFGRLKLGKHWVR